MVAFLKAVSARDWDGIRPNMHGLTALVSFDHYGYRIHNVPLESTRDSDLIIVVRASSSVDTLLISSRVCQEHEVIGQDTEETLTLSDAFHARSQRRPQQPLVPTEGAFHLCLLPVPAGGTSAASARGTASAAILPVAPAV